jgi:glycosyltransferase involved in cell wall biosynthesis
LPRKRILHFIETGGLGGAERAAVDLASRLPKERFESELASLQAGGWLEDSAKDLGIPFHLVPSGGSVDWRLIRGLIRLMHGGRFDLLQTHLMDSNFYGAVSGFLGRFPVVAVEHGDAHHPGKIHIQKIKPKTIGHLADAWVAVSRFTRDALVRRFNVPEKKIRVIPNGIPMDVYTTGGGKISRRDLGLPYDSFVLGAVGSLYPVKGHRYLIEAAARLAPSYPRLHVVIAGSGGEEERLRDLARDLGVAERVHLLGRRRDVPDLLKAFDVFVLPSESEAHPLSLCEAMATGLPSVASNVGGVPEVIQDGRSGLLVPPKDVDALARAVKDLIESRELRERLGTRARERVRQEYSTERMLERYSDLYEEVLAKRAGK